jgi:acyl carrier protein
MAANEQDLLARFGKIINEITGIPAEDVTLEKSFVDDLDIDSLSMVEIAVASQDEFDVEIPDDQLKNLKTVKDVLDFVQK